MNNLDLGTNDLNAMMADDGASQIAEVPRTAKLDELSKLLQDLDLVNGEVEALQEHLKEAEERQKELSMGKIPDLFDELGLSVIKMKDGKVVEINRSFAATISAENKDDCFNWLRKNGHDGIIKHDLTVKLKKGEEAEVAALISDLNERGLTYSDKEHVHPMTLKAFVREQIEKGSDLPQDKFGVFPIRKTKIK